MAKYYRVLEINKETGEKLLTISKWTSKKKATEWAKAFCKAINDGAKKDIADFEIRAF